jgi:hypothetical protein
MGIELLHLVRIWQVAIFFKMGWIPLGNGIIEIKD